MFEGDTAQADPGTPPGFRLAVRWADVTKALSIYPESNERVLAKLAGFLGALADHLRRDVDQPGHDAERGVTILFQGKDWVVGTEEGPMPDGSSLSWLSERLAHAGVAGVEWMADIDGPTLLAFTKQLLANYLRKEPGVAFESLWPDAFAGIVLIDRRFEGTFGGLATDGPYAGGHAGTAVRSADTNHFVRGLLAHPKVAKRVGQLQSRVATMDVDEHEDTVKTSDLITRILDDVPAEALKSRDALISAVCKVMDGLSEQAAPSGGSLLAGLPSDGSEQAGSDQFASLLYQVSRTHFARQGPGLERMRPDAEEAVVMSPAGGRSRDEEIGDDLPALAAELRTLPATPAYDLPTGDAECQGEQLAVLLHYLVQLERPEELIGLYPLLARLLEDPDDEALAVLTESLHEGETEAGAARQSAIVAFLLRAGRAPLLRECGILDGDFVLADPVARLPLLLAALDAGDAAHHAELNAICTKLGQDLFSHEAGLRAALGALPRTQAAACMLRPHPGRLPLVRLLLAAHPARLVPEATAFLRSIDLPEDEAFLLFQLHDPDHITREYLSALMDLHLGRTDTTTVHRAVVDLLCRHIRSTQTPLPEHPERLASIRSLARYPSANGWVMLKELQKTRFGPFGGAEPAAVRKAARGTAKRLRTQQDEKSEPANNADPADDDQAEAA